jgi:hypothetical protein
MKSGAEFSEDRKYRFSLWRIWDESKPLVMFIGLNPSTANETEPDNTIKRVIKISQWNGYGGFYMMNCFPIVSTDPSILKDFWQAPDPFTQNQDCINRDKLKNIALQCKDVVFAWGNFKVVKEVNRDKELIKMFPNAKALHINKNGSPKHPLYCKSESKLISYESKI